jgi:microcin C transport system substrate-binding protein
MLVETDRRRWRRACGILLLSITQLAAADDYAHGWSMLWDLKYPPDFPHFDWVEPSAPKGGTLRIPQMGTFDSFNSFIHVGRQAAGLNPLTPTNLLYDRLLEGAADEPVAAYGRLAEGVRVADDLSYVAFRLREGAYWHDGEPITVDDVIYSFQIYKAYGAAWIRTMFRDVERVEQIGPHEIRYVMREGSTPTPSITQSIGVMPVLPKHYWEERDPSSTTTVPPLGSGPYRIADHRIGRYVVYERVDDYWGRDLPVMRGRFNFDTVKFDYFRDEKVMLEAHRGHVVDVRTDSNAKNWATEYDFPAARAGLFRQELIRTTSPEGLQAPVFWNLRVDRFQDIRVREALWLLYDFEWINRVLHFEFYERGTSLFHGAPDMMQSGLPSADELALLEPYRHLLPQRLFTEPYAPPVNSGRGLLRDSVERALELFEHAGWVPRDGRLVHVESGEQFSIDFVLASHTQARALLPYVDALNRVGIATSVRVPEVSNWQYRLRTGAFDASKASVFPFRLPGIALRNYFGSLAAELGHGVNWGYVRNPVVDDLIEHVVAAGDKESFIAAVRAVDRVILWHFYFIPASASRGTPLVYWDKFGRPENGEPLERVPWIDAWWWEPDKARRVEQGMAADTE